MVKTLSLLPLMFALPIFAMPRFAGAEDYRSKLETEVNERNNRTLTGITGAVGNEFRLYHYNDLLIDQVDDNAFVGTMFESLMLTKNVKYINDTAFSNATNIKNLYYTGSEAEYIELHLEHKFDLVKYYAFDEGFINLWNDKIRKTANDNICDISQDAFEDMYRHYLRLSDEDKNTVNKTDDKAGVKIEASIKELTNHFSGAEKTQKTEEWNQTGAITLIIVIAVIGMTSITIFFLLKTKNIIQ